MTQNKGEGIFGDSEAFLKNWSVSKMALFVTNCQIRKVRLQCCKCNFFSFFLFPFHFFAYFCARFLRLYDDWIIWFAIRQV